MMFNTYIYKMLLAAMLLMLISLAVFYVSWVGVIGSDDQVYIENARSRIYNPFMVGTNHWEVRLTLTMPMALAFSVFGESEISAALPTLLYMFFTGVIVLLFLIERIGIYTSIFVSALIATSPLLVINATSLRIDAVENFLVIASLLLLLYSFNNYRNNMILILCGVCAGLAFITRPTAVALVVFYISLFIIEFRIQRYRYLLVAVGFIMVWVAESFYYLSTTGNFFYRLTVDFNHDHVVRGSSLVDAVMVEPVKMLLGSHNLGLIFWCLPLAAWYLIRNRGLSSEIRSTTIFFSLFCVTWIAVFSGFASKLVLDPRYLSPAVTAALVIIGLFIGTLMQSKKKTVALCLAFAFFTSHALAIYLENKEFSYSQRWLAVLAGQYDEPIYTDPQTYGRALFLLELGEVKDRVFPAPAPAGGLFLAVRKNAEQGFYNGIPWNPDDYDVEDWPVVEKLDPGRRRIGSLLEAAGLRDLIPASIWQKANDPNPPIFLYRRP